jgi:hypothetical protein
MAKRSNGACCHRVAKKRASGLGALDGGGANQVTKWDHAKTASVSVLASSRAIFGRASFPRLAS